jgi:hypothetical protein
MEIRSILHGVVVCLPRRDTSRCDIIDIVGAPVCAGVVAVVSVFGLVQTGFNPGVDSVSLVQINIDRGSGAER